MISVDRTRIDRHLHTPAYLPQQLPGSFSNIPSQDRITVLRDPHQVIFTVPYRMTACFIIFHPPILSQSPEGEGFADPL